MGSTDNWHIDRKTPKNLTPWDGRWESYKCFREMVEDHLVACNPLWQGLIAAIEAEKKQRLEAEAAAKEQNIHESPGQKIKRQLGLDN